jgi:ubiquinone/menaquinone biosynthesis C-methylase UbiE
MCVKAKNKERDTMSTPTDPRREHPSTYFVQDRSNQQELTRLQIQGQMLTTSLGGVLPEQPNPTSFQHVLDVGCGTGGWLIEAARTYPTMSLLIGVDVSSRMIEYAQAQAEAQQVSDRVQFHSMDALRMLEFPVGYFDLVNQRLGLSYLRTWDWPKLLNEFERVTRSGGVIRLTECDPMVESTSPAQTRLYQLFVQALLQAGHLFNRKSDGVINELAHLLDQRGFQNVQTRVHMLEYRAGTIEGQHFAEDLALFYQTIVPFLRKWTRLPDDYDAIYRQMLSETQQPEYVATWKLLTAWGHTPLKKRATRTTAGI